MNRYVAIGLGILLLGVATTGRASAQQMMLQKAVVASGGGMATSGTMTMYYTVGQPVVGTASNGIVNAMFGFWNGVFVVSPTGVDGGERAGAITSMKVSPNPVERDANLELTLARSGDVVVSVYDPSGARVRTLYSDRRTAGRFVIPFDATGLASGTYYVAATASGALVQVPVTVVR